MDNLLTSGERIEYLRSKMNMRQIDLARAVGVGRSMISEWERNVKRPNAKMAVKLADALNSNSMYILCDYEHPEPFIKVQVDDTYITASSNLDADKIQKILYLITNEPDRLDELINKLLSE